MSTKIFAIGWDSADKDLLLRWSDSGELPTLQKLRSQGRWGILTSPLGMGDEATWATLFTGVSPAKHGRFYSRQLRTGSYDLLRYKAANLKYEPFWESLSRAHKKVAILDVPKSELSTALKGIQLVDWMVHGPEARRVRSWPEHWAVDLKTTYGEALDCLCGGYRRPAAELEELFSRLKKNIEMKTACFLSVLEQEDWDLFLGVYKSTHCVGHMFWHICDPTHPSYNHDLAKKWENPIKKIYQLLDTSLGRLLERLTDDTIVIMFSDIGMGPNYNGNRLLPKILSRLEARSSRSSKTHLGWTRRTGKQLLGMLRLSLDPKYTRINRKAYHYERALSRFFLLPNNEVAGALRVNLKGREPNGCIHPGQEYEALCEGLVNEFRQIICPETRQPLIQDVIRPQNLYEGPYGHHLPDLLFIWNQSQYWSQVWSPNIGTINAESLDRRSGKHIANGIMFASGPGITNRGEFGPVSSMDLSATIGNRLGVPLPDIDGKPIPELLEENTN